MVDKYFDANGGHNRLRANVAKAICRRCVVQAECLDEALSMAHPPTRGVIGGISATQLQLGRTWRNYEQGTRDTVPRRTRPVWLPMTDATHQVEQLRTELDPDEPNDR